MHTVTMLEQALTVLQQLGYRLRHEWFGGQGGGACQVKGRKWFFLDLALSHDEQLAEVVDCLRHEDQVSQVKVPVELARMLRLQR